MDEYYAHSRNDDGQGVPDALEEHLRRVAERAAQFAAGFRAEQQAAAAGLLHDLGKYADQFQQRLSDPNREPARDHSSAGALLVAACYKHLGALPALAIEGHHAGLGILRSARDLASDLSRAMSNTPDAFTEANPSLLKERFEADSLSFPKVEQGLVPSGELSAADMLDVRMLFSALVDADFIETEAHFAGDASQRRRYRPAGPLLDPAGALDALQARVAQVRQEADVDGSIRRVRDVLLEACLCAAAHPPGLFTLSAPTGSGKTLAMLAFALRHALEHDLRRIVLVMPFLNIIDQTANEYRRIFSAEHRFPAEYVIEDHSNVRTPDEEREHEGEDSVEEHVWIERLLAQNWDAPIILTTSVQCLESLMSNRPSACRKLHRLARSVILFDEVQTLPQHLAVPTLAVLSRLSECFRTTIVFATATQPAFDHLHEQVTRQSPDGWQATEIVPDPGALFQPAARRVRVRWRHCDTLAWEPLANELSADRRRQALCIVNLKRHARRLAELLRDRGAAGLYHLSTNMCPAHRAKVLEDVAQGLKHEQPVRLVSTQCVEAGVDLDFPVVYRALGPLEAIAQAAGRCNRHGTRPQPGEVHVFRPEMDGRLMCPPGGYDQAAQATETYLNGLSAAANGQLDGLEILNDPGQLRAYYRQYYTLTGIAGGSAELNRALEECDFQAVAREYRLIDQDTINILVPYDVGAFERLIREIEEEDPLTPEFIRRWVRRARPYTVSIYRPGLGEAVWAHVSPIQFSRRRERDIAEASWFRALPHATHDELLGWLGGDDSFVI